MKKQFGFAFFLSIYMQLLEASKPDDGWPYIPEFIQAISPAAAALAAHLTVLCLILLELPTEDNLRTKVSIWKKRRVIKNKLKDTTLSASMRTQLEKQLDLLHIDEIKASGVTLTLENNKKAKKQTAA